MNTNISPVSVDTKPYQISEDDILRKIQISDDDSLVITTDFDVYLVTPSGVYSSPVITRTCMKIIYLGLNHDEIVSNQFQIPDKDSIKMIKWPIKLKDANDLLYSHNSIIALWAGNERIWIGEAWTLPDEYQDLHIMKFFGTVADKIWESDTINITVDTTNETPKNLPKKYHNNEGCSDSSNM